jgi:hypothetical protein
LNESAHECRAAALLQIFVSTIINTGSKTQIQRKKIALMGFLNVCLTNTDPGEDAYEYMIYIMEIYMMAPFCFPKCC